MKPLLSIENLQVTFPSEDGLVRAVDDVSLTLNAGETVAIVGESGSGKTVTSLSVMGLHNRRTTQVAGAIKIQDGNQEVDVISGNSETVRRLRGRVVSMIFQDPMSSLHPYYSVGDQISEAWLLYNKGDKQTAKKRSIEMLD